MGMDVDEMDDSLDELRSITVTFLNTDQDFMNYMFTIRAQRLRTSTDATALGLPQGTKFLYNYFNVEVPPEFTNFEAQVTIEFHLSSRSQLGTKTADILSNIRLVSKHSDENRFEVLDIIGKLIHRDGDATPSLQRNQRGFDLFSLVFDLIPIWPIYCRGEGIGLQHHRALLQRGFQHSFLASAAA